MKFDVNKLKKSKELAIFLGMEKDIEFMLLNFLILIKNM